MCINGMIDPAELAMLRKAVDDHCSEKALTDKEREHVASLVMDAFRNGARNLDDLKTALNPAARHMAA